jgi:hypothetical protein
VETPFVVVFPQAAYDETTSVFEIDDPYGQQRVTKFVAHCLNLGYGVVSCRAGNSAGVDNWGNFTNRQDIIDVLHYVQDHWAVDSNGFVFFGPSMGACMAFNVLARCDAAGDIPVAGIVTIDGVFDLRDMYNRTLNTHDQGVMQDVGATENIAESYMFPSGTSCVVDSAEWIDWVNEPIAGFNTEVGCNPVVANYSGLPDTPTRIFWNDSENVVDSDWNSVPMNTKLLGLGWTDVDSIDTGAASHLAFGAFDDVVDACLTGIGAFIPGLF